MAEQNSSIMDVESLDRAAQTLAACMDYPWDHMPEQGRENMRLHAAKIFNAAAAPLLARAAELERLSVTNIMTAVVPGDGDGYEVYANSPEDVEKLLSELSMKLDDAETERDKLRTLCSAAYQLAGCVGASTEWLDALGDAAAGEIGARFKGEYLDLLPVVFDAGQQLESARAGVPEGWQLVPVEPTEAMIDAGCLTQFTDEFSTYDEWRNGQSDSTVDLVRKYVTDDYIALLAAAPQPDGQAAIPPKPWPESGNPGKWFPITVVGDYPMREFAPGKWEHATWPSERPDGQGATWPTMPKTGGYVPLERVFENAQGMPFNQPATRQTDGQGATGEQVVEGSPRDYVQFVYDTFKADIARGYITRDKTFAVDLLGKFLEAPRAEQPIPDECIATGRSCSYGPHGPNGEEQCRYCGAERAEQPEPAGEVTVTTDRTGAVVLVSRQDHEGRILSVIWEADGPYGALEHKPEPAAQDVNAELLAAHIEDCLKQTRKLVPMAYNDAPTPALQNQLGNLLQEWSKVATLMRAEAITKGAAKEVPWWLPIETAPKDGTDILGLLPDGAAVSVVWVRGEGWIDRNGDDIGTLIGWKPLPATLRQGSADYGR